EVSNPELLAGIRERILLAALSKEDTVALLEDDELDIEDDSDQVGERQHGGDSEGLRLWAADVSKVPPAGGRAGGGEETASDTGARAGGGEETASDTAGGATGPAAGAPKIAISAAAAGFNPPQSYGSRIERRDCFGNQIIRLVHTNGVQYITLLSCSCSGTNNWVANLAHATLIPTSFHSPRTFFTTAILDDYRLTNLECKSSAYQYWQKICRVTSTTAPGEVDDLYRELRRLSRSWRWLKKIKWAGFPHTGKSFMDPEPGELAIFCPTCPQPGINLPTDWEDDPETWKFK
ncbi:hypothetical protein C0991_010898, partial [Blastosporella zonata]